MKHCGGCDRDKELDDFHKSKRTKDGLATQCKVCTSERSKKWYAGNTARKAARGAAYHKANLDRARDNALRRKYGISLADFESMEGAQGGVCALCSQPERKTNVKTGEVQHLSVDHCHDTGRVRGLLCKGCNYAVGYFGDNEEGALRLLHYLEV